MPNQNDTIKSNVVKIEDNGAFLQSGVLWMPSEESEVAYVFTVKHGIEKSTPTNIRFWHGSNEFDFPVSKVLFHSDNAIDTAILVISNCGLPVSPFAFLALHDLEALGNKESMTVPLQVLGYPAIRCSVGYPGPNQQHYFPCSIDNPYENESTRTFLASYDSSARISPTDPEADLEGFSGGGLFARIQNVVFLCGIYCGTPTEAVHNRDITLLSLRAIQEICSDYNLPPINFQPLIPDSLSKHLGLCLCELGSDHILKDCLQEVSRCNFTELIRTSCGQCNPCEYGEHFYLCDRFQQQMLNSSALINYHNVDFKDDEALKVLKSEEYHEVRIICSDVRPTRVFELIRFLKQDYLGRNNLSENTLILWTGKERCKQSHASCTRTEYQNIICDIAKAPQNPLDFSDVNEAPEQLAVINVPYILDEMEANPKAFSDFVDRM